MVVPFRPIATYGTFYHLPIIVVSPFPEVNPSPPIEEEEPEVSVGEFDNIFDVAFPAFSDINFVYRQTDTYCERWCPTIGYYVLKTAVAELDEVHGEIPDYKKTWHDPVDLRIYINPEEEKQIMDLRGTQEVRPLSLEVAGPSLLKVGLAEVNEEKTGLIVFAGAGDKFIYSGFEYRVVLIKRGETWANTDIPVFYTIIADRLPPDPYDDEE